MKLITVKSKSLELDLINNRNLPEELNDTQGDK